ncbi:MAG TPA: glycosyltransferase family 4 protein [Ignavibacteria bacterium]
MNFTDQSLGIPITKIPKTLILIPNLSIPGGVANYYKTLGLNAISNITYFTINKEKPQSASATAIRLLTNYCKFIFKLIKDRYEVVVVNPSLDEGKSFYRDLIFIIITHILNRKTVVFFHGWFEPYEEKIKRSKFKSFLFRISYAKAGKYLVLGDIFKQKLISLGVPPETEFFIETMVADSSYIKDLDLKNKYLTYKTEINFLFLSRIEKEKGIYIAIDAFKEFLNKFPQRRSSLIIAGDGLDLPAVKAYVEGNEIPNIKFLGHVSGENKRKVLLESHVMIFPSFTEGLPNVILEGMLYGMPIISRVTGGIPEVVHQKINGYLSESFNPSVFADFLSILALDEELYKKIAKENHSTALEKYTVEKVRERIFNIFGKIEV